MGTVFYLYFLFYFSQSANQAVFDSSISALKLPSITPN